MKRKTAGLFFISCMKTADIKDIKRLIITLLTDTDGKTWAKKSCNTVSLAQSVNSDTQIKKKRLFIQCKWALCNKKLLWTLFICLSAENTAT